MQILAIVGLGVLSAALAEGQTPPTQQAPLTARDLASFFNTALSTSLAQAATVSFSFNPGSLSFTGVTDGPPSIAVLGITANGILAFNATASTTDGRSWLRASPESGTTPGTVQVVADPQGLPPARYVGSISFNSPFVASLFGTPLASSLAQASTAPGSSVVPVTFEVQASSGPRLVPSPSNLSFSLVRGGLPTTQVVVVTNRGSGAAQVNVTARTVAGGNWLAVSPAAGSVTGSMPLGLAVTANPSGLPAGTYSGFIAIAAVTGEADVAVTLSVSDATQKISLSQLGFTFYGVSGLPPGERQSLTVSNAGNGTLQFGDAAQTFSGGSWLSVSPASGSATSGGNGADLEIGVDSSNLAPGDYYGNIGVSSNGASNSPQTASVVLRVVPRGTSLGIRLTPAALVFLGSGSQTINISTPGDGSFGVNASDDFHNGPAFFRHTGGTGGVTAARPLTTVVQADATGLQPGLYFGDLVIAVSDGTAQRVTVVLGVPPRSFVASPRDAGSCEPARLVPVITTFTQTFFVSVGFPTPIEVRVVDDCASITSTGSVAVTFSNGDPLLPLSPLNDGRWTGTWAGRNSNPNVVLTVRAQSRDLQVSGTAVISGALQADALSPSIAPGGILNGASFAPDRPLAPGSFVSLFGDRLAQSQLVAAGAPLPLTLSGTSISLAGRAAPLFFTSGGQVNAILPYGLPVNTTLQIFAKRETAISVPFPIGIAAAAPGIFSYGQNRGIIVGVDAAGGQTLVTAANPVRGGQTIVIYCTGLGEVTPPVPAGAPTPITELSKTNDAVTLTIGGIPASVAFAGLTPGQIGLYQVNAVVPAGVPPGDSLPVILTAAGQQSAPVVISVR